MFLTMMILLWKLQNLIAENKERQNIENKMIEEDKYLTETQRV